MNKLVISIAALHAFCFSTISSLQAQSCPHVRVTPSTFDAFDHFGRSLALGDNILAVGASDFDGGSTNSGAVFIFRFINGDWVQTAMLQAPIATAEGRFGESVSLDGDTLAVGAFGDTDKGLKAGAVYIFNFKGGEWTQTIKLTAEDTTGGDRFGNSLSLSGDLLVVGAPYSDITALNAGAAYAFRLSNSVWAQESRLNAADPQEGDAFGHAVDTDNTSILVGAYLDDERGTDSGSATVFTYRQGSWQQQAHIVPLDSGTNDWIGHNQLAIAGSDIVIGAMGDDDHGTNSGAAYFYTFTENAWQFKQKLAPSQLQKLDSFGKSLAFENGVLLIGARFSDQVAIDGGAAYLFDLVNGTWRLRSLLTVPTNLPAGEFGRGIAIGDGRIAVGAHRHQYLGKTEVGATWVYDVNQCRPCYADCDQSTGLGTLDVFDFLCFQNAFVANQTYACDCDTTTGSRVCDIFDFLCFQNAFVAGCQ